MFLSIICISLKLDASFLLEIIQEDTIVSLKRYNFIKSHASWLFVSFVCCLIYQKHFVNCVYYTILVCCFNIITKIIEFAVHFQICRVGPEFMLIIYCSLKLFLDKFLIGTNYTYLKLYVIYVQ